MALTVTINCENIKIHLPDNVLLNYHYFSNTDGYAKGYPKYVKLNLVIDVLALLSDKDASLEENLITLDNLRIWGNQKFKRETKDYYYRRVILKQTHEDAIFRTIKFSHAYVNNFTENIELSKRVHTITLELLQKKDKLHLRESKGGLIK